MERLKLYFSSVLHFMSWYTLYYDKPPVLLHGILVATEDGLAEFTNNVCLHTTQFPG